MERVVAPLVMLLMLAIGAAVAGGGFAFGAWVIWRLLEQYRSSPASGRGVPLPAVFLGLSLLGALIFAFGPRSPMPVHFAVLSFVPFVTLSLAGCGVVWLVRRALRGAGQ